jgi:glucose-6-phosphate isomerase
MTQSTQELWNRFKKYYTHYPELGLSLDLSRMGFPEDLTETMAPQFQKAFAAMAELEKGAIANPDEKRMVGHYWLRNPALAPTAEIRKEIETALAKIVQFAADVHAGKIQGKSGPFKNLLLIGIGGSALGPQFVSHALGQPGKDKMSVFFFDNTDPDGMDYVLEELDGALDCTLCIVVSKSGGTKETRNGMLEAEFAYKRAGLDFAKHAVAVTSEGSELDKYCSKNEWLDRFPMWDWVGGRTSELSAVGLLPAALQGIDVTSMLAGAKACDEATRFYDLKQNPAACLALAWHFIGNGKGDRNMIVLPYRDRLVLFSKYLQQLIMESIGKALDVQGNTVHQGISVFGNKGSTDQHAYVQQLRDGRNDFFVTFIEVLRDRAKASELVEPGATSGDFLNGFYLGTRSALYESNRPSVTLTLVNITPFSVGLLIALFERAVGFYASLVNINAYHQPGVEAGKKAAGVVLALQGNILAALRESNPTSLTVEELSAKTGSGDFETIFKICEHLSANPDRGIARVPGSNPFGAKYGISKVT